MPVRGFMFGACNPNGQVLHSPARAESPSASSSDLLNKFVHNDSPRSSPSLFKRPAPAASKWKAALARLSPPHLLPVPAASLLKPSIPHRRHRRPDRHLSTPPPQFRAGASDEPIIRPAALPADAHLDPVVALDLLQALPPNGEPAALDLEPCPHPSSHLASSFPHPLSNVQHLLDALAHLPPTNGPHTDAITARSRSLDALCSLCIALPSAVDHCVAAGGIDAVLGILDATRDSHTAADAWVEESEKALLLLQLLTSSSEAGCAVARRCASFTITTLGKKLLRVSETCTAYTITVFIGLCNHAEAGPFCTALSESSIPSKLVVVLQVASKDSTKRRAGRLLRLLREKQQSGAADDPISE